MPNSALTLQNALKHCAVPIAKILNDLSPSEVAKILADWPLWARPDQLPNEVCDTNASWKTWLMLGGRGAGKTRAGSEWIRYNALGLEPVATLPAKRIALIGPTLGEVRSVMVEGVSGLLGVHPKSQMPKFISSQNKLVWPNGSIAQLFSAEEPDSLRGPQFDLAWCDELAKWRYLNETWDMLQFGLRMGENPRVLVTTTPRPVALLKQLLEDKQNLVSRASTYDNKVFLAASFLKEIDRQYAGTRLGRQEINGELITDNPEALFSRDVIEKLRVKKPPVLERIVVAVDPPITSKKASNACGIVCAGLAKDGRAYVLDDATIQKAKPLAWAKKAIALYEVREADVLVVEVNQGGEMVSTILNEVDASVPVKSVHATRGKHLRAEPVAALYEQGRVCHVGAFPALEDEMCSFEQTTKHGRKSPDRVDALVWALTELLLKPRNSKPRISFL